MQQFSQKYTIVHFFKPLADGTGFASSDWPPHITLAETFAIHSSTSDLIDTLSRVSKNHLPVQTTALDDAHFGPDHSIPVTLIDTSPVLSTLHNDIITVLKDSCGATFNNPQYVQQGYRAHSTIRPDARLHAGDHITINSLSIVDMFPNNDPYRRKVIQTFRLARSD